MSRTSKTDEVTEMCCGAACDRDVRDAQLKLLGAREYVRMYKANVVLTAAQEHCLDVIESEYHMTLVPLKA